MPRHDVPRGGCSCATCELRSLVRTVDCVALARHDRRDRGVLWEGAAEGPPPAPPCEGGGRGRGAVGGRKVSQASWCQRHAP